jgi:hypothetical protein
LELFEATAQGQPIPTQETSPEAVTEESELTLPQHLMSQSFQPEDEEGMTAAQSNGDMMVAEHEAD